MVDLMALSSVIGSPIYSAFPNDNSKTRPLFHGEISPCETPIQTDPAFIVWSRDGSHNTRPEGWYQTNHFVPVVERLAISSPEKCPVTSPIKKPVKDGTKTKAKRKTLDFFSSSSAKKSRMEPKANPLAKPDFGDCDEAASVQRESKKGQPSNSQCADGVAPKHQTLAAQLLKGQTRNHPSKSGDIAERAAEKNYEQRRRREFKENWKEIYPWLQHDAVWCVESIQNLQTLQAPFTKALVAMASIELKP